MKILVPVLRGLPLDTGFGFRSLKLALPGSAESDLRVTAWRGFESLQVKTIPFNQLSTVRRYIPDIFSEEVIQKSGVVTVEFDLAPKISVEGQLLIRSKGQQNWASLLYNLIPDKKHGHAYSPILHSAHSAYVSEYIDTYALLVNFRPPYLNPKKESQNLKLQLKSANGDVFQTRDLDIPFNTTNLFSFETEFKPYGGFQRGHHLVFKGGESQFAIFTMFLNKNSHAIGMEHSLPPIYYCSDIYNPKSRQLFYDNALRVPV